MFSIELEGDGETELLIELKGPKEQTLELEVKQISPSNDNEAFKKKANRRQAYLIINYPFSTVIIILSH